MAERDGWPQPMTMSRFKGVSFFRRGRPTTPAGGDHKKSMIPWKEMFVINANATEIITQIDPRKKGWW